jgi:hypothetical protein
VLTETATERLARRQRQQGQLAAFLRAGPYEPLASKDEVLEEPCEECPAGPGEVCDTRPPRPSLAWAVFPGWGDIHLRRYLARTHDPR